MSRAAAGMATAGTPARAGAERAAIAWEVHLRGARIDGDVDADADPATLRDFRAWLAQAPEHAAAWAALQERLARMGAAGAPDARAIARALRTPDAERRRALRAGFGTLALALGGLGAWRGVQGLEQGADWRSGIGERGAGRLADGSPLRFDAGSRIVLARDGAHPHPHLMLHAGQLLVQARGPLTVSVGATTVTSAGGQLAVGRIGRRHVVAVGTGRAQVRGADGAVVGLDAGASVQAEDGILGAGNLSFRAATAWTHGLLVADRLPLPDLAEALGRYHRGLLHVGGAAAERTVSGVFALERQDDVLRQLAAALPVRVERYGRYVTVIA